MIRATSRITAMLPYALAQMAVPEGKALVSLSQNESLRPPSPMVADAVARAMASPQLYPDPNWDALRTALADLHGVPADQILCSNGSMELILCLALCFADAHRVVMIPAHAYPFFRTVTELAGAHLATVPETPSGVSVEALAEAASPDTALVFIANPGNPTGTRLSYAALARLRSRLPEQTLLVIDEAYGEFADHLDRPAFDLVSRGDTVVLRSFSKAYGLAGLRVGWGGFPPKILRELRKMIPPNSVSVLGQAAAQAALEDQSYMRETCALTASLRARFITRMRKASFDLPDSHTNFALVRFADQEQAQQAELALRAQGVVARAQGGADLPNCLRVTIGNQSAMDLAADVLEHWAKGGLV